MDVSNNREMDMYPKFRTTTAMATGTRTGTGIEKGIEVRLRVGRNKKN